MSVCPMTLLQPRCNLRATSLRKPQPFLLATLQRIHRIFCRGFLHCLDLSTNACLEALHLSAELAMETANGTVQRTLTRFSDFPGFWILGTFCKSFQSFQSLVPQVAYGGQCW